MNDERQKDPASLQHIECFTAEDLLAYKTGGLPAKKRSIIFHHLNVDKCPRCREIYYLLEPAPQADLPPKISEKMVQRLKGIRPLRRWLSPPTSLEIGQLWTTSPEPKDARGKPIASIEAALPVVIISPGSGEKSYENVIRVIPLSFDTQYHLEGETLLIHEESPLGYPVLLEIFNERPMLAGNLDEYRGMLEPSVVKRVISARERFLEGNIPQADTSYLAWKQKEMELANYLSYPVNMELFSEEKIHNAFEIPLRQYKKAAEVKGIGLDEISPHVLLETQQFCLAVVQKRDQMLLRLSYNEEDQGTPASLMINGETVSMKTEAPLVYEALLGQVDILPTDVEISGKILDFEFDLFIHFTMDQKQ